MVKFVFTLMRREQDGIFVNPASHSEVSETILDFVELDGQTKWDVDYLVLGR